jgi:hypothetical protein
MRRLAHLILRPLAVAAASLALLPAGAALADNGPDHLHLDVRHVGCEQVQVSGHQLPKRARLELRYLDAEDGRRLDTTTVRTAADGRLVADRTMPLNGVRTIRVQVHPAGSGTPLAFGEETIQGECRLPFTGSRELLLLGLAAAALLLGAGALSRTPYPGRHLLAPGSGRDRDAADRRGP